MQSVVVRSQDAGTQTVVRPPKGSIRCAIYTRKSSEEGLEQEFNSLHAQREAGESFVASQKAQGWTCLAERYDDGGYSGGNTDRPALLRLMADIAAGKVDCVVVYKIDRLSRSLLDFARMMTVFEKHAVTLVAVTQSFNTANSMGRLVLNVLLSFAQFERELISERTRDKIAATRRKGKWTGGRPVLGYDLDRSTQKLHVNEQEANQVRAIFAMYLERESLIGTLRAIEEKGWRMKGWTSKRGTPTGGQKFDKASLFRLLTNVTYAGQVRYKKEVHPGEHVRIVDPVTWKRVQHLLVKNGRSGGGPTKNAYQAMLRGILRCGPCGCAMVHSITRKGAKVYRYYCCSQAQKRGRQACSSRPAPAGELERLVLEQVKLKVNEPEMLAAIQGKVREDANGGKARHEPGHRNGHARGDADVATQMREFTDVWEMVTPKERARVVQLLIERVTFDGAKGEVSIAMRSETPSKPAINPIEEMAA